MIDELCELLWGDTEPSLAKAQLRVALSHLRKLLNVTETTSEFLVADHVHIHLKGKVHCDAVKLREEIENIFSLDGLERANEIERIFNELPASPLFSGLHHEALLNYWYGIEHKLQELTDWCLHYYVEQGNMSKAKHFNNAVGQFFPDYEYSVDVKDC